MMRTFFINNWKWLLAIVAVWGIGFLMGRSSEKVVSKVEYKPGKPVRDTFYALTPEHSKIPDNPVLPKKRDTIFQKGNDDFIEVPYYVKETVDTSEIINQYVTENKYSTKLFDDKEKGKLIVNSTVQYNKLQGMGFDFTPMEKITTIERKPTFTPFVTGSYNSLKHAGIGGGIYIKNVGIGAKLITDTRTGQTAYEGGLYIKF